MIAVVFLALFLVACESNAAQETTTRVIRPQVCSKNQVAVPDKGTCKCKPGFLSLRSANKPRDCYLAFRQGPCPVNKILVHRNSKFHPECLDNPCKKDGLVRYQGKCYTLNSKGPCTKNKQGVERVLRADSAGRVVKCLVPLSKV